MLTALDDRPTPPSLPQFSRDMEQFLIAAARANTSRRPVPTTRYVKYAAAGLATAAVAAAAAIGIDDAVNGGSHAPGANQTGATSTQLAAFTVEINPGGTVTLRLTQGQMFDPRTLQNALAAAHVLALVTVGSVCTTPLPSDALNQVLSRSSASNGQSVTTITPSAIPTGEELSIGYFAVPDGGGLHISLVPVNATLTCTATPPPPPRHRG